MRPIDDPVGAVAVADPDPHPAERRAALRRAPCARRGSRIRSAGRSSEVEAGARFAVRPRSRRPRAVPAGRSRRRSGPRPRCGRPRRRRRTHRGSAGPRTPPAPGRRARRPGSRPRISAASRSRARWAASSPPPSTSTATESGDLAAGHQRDDLGRDAAAHQPLGQHDGVAAVAVGAQQVGPHQPDPDGAHGVASGPWDRCSCRSGVVIGSPARARPAPAGRRCSWRSGRPGRVRPAGRLGQGAAPCSTASPA